MIGFEEFVNSQERGLDGQLLFYYTRSDGERKRAKIKNYIKTEKGWFNTNSPEYIRYKLEQNEDINC